MSETVRIRDEDYEAMAAVQELLGLPFPEVLHLSLTLDGADQAKAGLTIGAQKHESRLSKSE